MTTIEKPETGRIAEDNRIGTNYLEAGGGPGTETIVLVLDVFAYSRQLVEDELADVPLHTGHEAVSVGAVSAMCSDDYPTQSQSVESYFAHVPGLKIVMPGTPQDAAGAADQLDPRRQPYDSPTTTARTTGSPRPGSSPPFDTR